MSTNSSITAPTVVACYSVFDHFFPALGFTDLTDGLYEGDPTRSYEHAQARQADVLLDRAERSTRPTVCSTSAAGTAAS